MQPAARSASSSREDSDPAHHPLAVAEEAMGSAGRLPGVDLAKGGAREAPSLDLVAAQRRPQAPAATTLLPLIRASRSSQGRARL